MIKAEFYTRNFIFTAYGDSKEHALSLLASAWDKHCSQYTDADEYLLRNETAGVYYADVSPGCVFRDDEDFIANETTIKNPEFVDEFSQTLCEG